MSTQTSINSGSWPAVLRMVLVFLFLLGTMNGFYQLERRYVGHWLDQPYSDLVARASALLGSLFLPFEIHHKGLLTLGTDRFRSWLKEDAMAWRRCF